MRYSIGLKVFGIALFLLALMLVVSLVSNRLVGRVQNQVDAIANYYVPINGAISGIDVHVLEQEIHIERLKSLYLSDRENTSAIRREQRGFRERDEQIDVAVAATLEQIRRGLQSEGEEIDKIQLARLEPMLEAVEREHQHFNDLSLNLIQALRKGDTAQYAKHSERLVREEDDYDRQIDRIREELEQFTLSAALQARDDEKNVRFLGILLSSIAAILGLGFAGMMTAGLVKPLKQLVSAIRGVEEGNLDITVQVASRDEVGALANSFNHMVSELRVKERIKDTFGKYLDPRVVGTLIETPDAVIKTVGEKRVMTMFFSDIVGFTSISENLMPDALVKLINEYFTLQTIPIHQSKGIVDKFIGDSVMAFWGPPFTQEDEHARLACLSALEQMEQLEKFRRRLPDLMGIRTGLPNFDFRIGIATGEVVVGNIGSELSMSYTVMGDTVNLASRLEGANKHYGTRFLISETTQQLVRDEVETREIDLILVVGKTEPVRVFELLARKGDLNESEAQLRGQFQSGLIAYRSRDWQAATEHFDACLELDAHDAPAQVFLQRVDYLKKNQPPDEWDGVWHFAQK